LQALELLLGALALRKLLEVAGLKESEALATLFERNNKRREVS
jgi:hypothetical protein